MANDPAVVAAPRRGLWRVGRGPDPLAIRPPPPGDLVASRSGNRFDSETQAYGVLYFGTDLEVCFGETLSRFRPSLAVLQEIEEEWRALHFMEIGAIPAEWRQRRSAVLVQIEPPSFPFLDVEATATHQYLRRELATGLAALGYDDLDVGVIRGSDRRVTRLIGDWAWRQANEVGEARFAGLRYLSRLNTDWECWAVFHDVELQVVETMTIDLEVSEFRKVAELYGLTPH